MWVPQIAPWCLPEMIAVEAKRFAGLVLKVDVIKAFSVQVKPTLEFRRSCDMAKGQCVEIVYCHRVH